MKVLVADDSGPIRHRVVERLLSISGVDIFEAEDTDQALQKFEEIVPDIAVLDIRMPGGGGIHALTQIKAARPAVPVIIITNYPYAQYRRKCLEAGADFFFDKSTEFEQIAATVQKIMNSGVDHVARQTTATQLVEAKEALEKLEQRQRDLSLLSLFHSKADPASLKEAHTMWERTFDAIPDMVSLFDVGHRIIRVNKAMADWLDVPASELAGKKCYEYMHGTTCPINGCPHMHMLEDGGGHEMELEDQRTGKWLAVSVTPVKEHDRVIGSIHIAKDITERKKAEEAVARARDAAEEANLAKNQLLANMSHELRTPLNAIIGLAELLKTSPLDDEQKDYVGTISNSGEALLGLISDLLDFSKIEMGKLEIKNTRFSIREAVEKAIALVSMQAAGKKIELTSSVAADVPETITSDPRRLQQVLVNLLNNAVKFTERGFIRLSVDQWKAPSGIVMVEFSVADSGSGMNEATLQKIFRPFEQGDNSSTREYGGSGLGLAISKNLVEQMGGTIRVQSQKGEGSVFTFDIADRPEPQR